MLCISRKHERVKFQNRFSNFQTWEHTSVWWNTGQHSGTFHYGWLQARTNKQKLHQTPRCQHVLAVLKREKACKPFLPSVLPENFGVTSTTTSLKEDRVPYCTFMSNWHTDLLRTELSQLKWIFVKPTTHTSSGVPAITWLSCSM